MAAILAISIGAFCLALGVLGLFGSRLLRGWYLHEIRRTPVAQESNQAIVSYPLA